LQGEFLNSSTPGASAVGILSGHARADNGYPIYNL
jgi:hypothetical protein